mmetsp:Transcript_2809/g.3281  ORF Transcript_2809/g.3281 Transcript_2809/m.3281 type:complete len:135 (+) Transcript_2809:6-410(+)
MSTVGEAPVRKRVNVNQKLGEVNTNAIKASEELTSGTNTLKAAREHLDYVGLLIQEQLMSTESNMTRDLASNEEKVKRFLSHQSSLMNSRLEKQLVEIKREEDETKMDMVQLEEKLAELESEMGLDDDESEGEN